jgi:hypothetical protein
MGERLQATEHRQQQIMAFLAKAVQTPGFLAHLVAQSGNNTLMAASARKKRRLAKGEIEGEVEDSFDPAATTDGQIIALQTNGEVVHRIMQLLSPSDDNPTINEGYLYPLISDHDSAPVSSEGNTLNQQSGVTFMDPSTGLAEHVHSDPVVTDPKKNEDIVQLHPTSPTSDVARAAGIRRSYAWFPVPNAFKGSPNTILESPILTLTIIFVFCCYEVYFSFGYNYLMHCNWSAFNVLGLLVISKWKCQRSTQDHTFFYYMIVDWISQVLWLALGVKFLLLCLRLFHI